MKVLNPLLFSYFDYESAENHGNQFNVGDVVARADEGEIEIGVVLQVYNEHEVRTDMFGNEGSDFLHHTNQHLIKKHRPELLDYLIPTSKKQLNRLQSLFPNNTPKNIRCYDNGKSGDRYTCVFTGRYTHKTGGEHWYLGMSADPFHPQGIGQHGSSPTQIDKPKYSHLGKKVSFDTLPLNVRKCIIQAYLYLWGFTTENGKTKR